MNPITILILLLHIQHQEQEMKEFYDRYEINIFQNLEEFIKEQ